MDRSNDERKPAASFASSDEERSPYASAPNSGDEADDDADFENPNPIKKRAKPALTKKEKRREKRDKHLQWDEAAIEEHNKLRGTRMKIDEPKTPHAAYDSGAESDDSRRARSPANEKQVLSWDTLQTRLDSVAAVQIAYPSSPSAGGETDASDVEEDKKKEMRRLEFEERRKRHYNEMEKVRQFRSEKPNYDVDGDADIEDDDDDED